MLLDDDGAHTRTTAAVRDGEGLVQVEVGHIATEVTRAQQPREGVEVGAVDVDLAAGVVDEGGDLSDLRLEDAVGGRVREHDGRDALTVLGQELAQMVDVDGAVLGGGDHRDAEAGAGGRGGVRAVGAGGYQDEVALLLPGGPEVAAHRQQAGELALGAGGRLQAAPVVAGQPRQPVGETVQQQAPAARLGRGGVGVDAGEPWAEPHGRLRGRVELEGARAQRDHRPVEGEVAVRQPPDVAHEGGLAAVAVEARVGQEGARARQRGGQGEPGGAVGARGGILRGVGQGVASAAGPW